MSEEYPLEVLLEMRERERDEAQTTLSQEMADLERRQRTVREKTAELEEVRERRVEARDAADQAIGAGISVARMQVSDEYQLGLEVEEQTARGRVDEAMQEVARQRRSVEKARGALEAAQKELLAVEKHHAKWKEEQDVVAKRKASSEMDEIAMRLWQKENS